MWKCWERYGKKHIEPEIVEQHLYLLRPKANGSDNPAEIDEHIWILIPLIPMLPQQSLTLMQSSHRSLKLGYDKPYTPSVQPGQALMYDARLRTRDPAEGGVVVYARSYDMTE